MSQMEDGMTGIFGAIIGDIVGSKYEANPIKTKHFPLFSNGCRFTDDTVMTCAVAEGIMNGGSADDFIDAMKKYGRMYPNAGYGPRFMRWLFSDSREPIGSFGNGSAMRISPCAWMMSCGFTARTGFMPIGGRELAERSITVTHDDPEGVRGGMAVADSIFLARYYFGGCRGEHERSLADDPAACRQRIEDHIIHEYGYNMSRSLGKIRSDYRFDATCQGSVHHLFPGKHRFRGCHTQCGLIGRRQRYAGSHSCEHCTGRLWHSRQHSRTGALLSAHALA